MNFQIFFSALSLIFGLARIFSKELCSFPRACRIIRVSDTQTKNMTNIHVLCSDTNAKYDLVQFERSQSACPLKKPRYPQNNLDLTIRPNEKNTYLVQNSIEILKLTDFAQNILCFTVNFVGMKGFNIESPILKIQTQKTHIFKFSQMPFNFYDHTFKLLRTCDDFMNYTGQLLIVQGLIPQPLIFSNVDFRQPVCELAFKMAIFDLIKIDYMSNTFFKRNVLQFINSSWYQPEIFFSVIYKLFLNDFYLIDINSRLLNERVFYFTGQLTLNGKINSIQNDLFRKFPRLGCIEINSVYFNEINRKQGIEWIKSMNLDVNVNLSNPVEVSSMLDRVKTIKFLSEREFHFDENFENFYEQDFCLFAEFPFRQLIIFKIISGDAQKKSAPPNCVTRWLTQFNGFIMSFLTGVIANGNISNEVKNCDFQK